MSTEPDDLKAFTDALAGVPPDPGQFDRDALLFAARRAAGPWGVFWPTMAAALAILSGALTVTLVTRAPTIIVVERPVYVPTPIPQDEPVPETVPVQEDHPAPTRDSPPPALVEGLRLRQRVLRDGVSALPHTPWASPLPN